MASFTDRKSQRYAPNFWFACTMFSNAVIYAIHYQCSIPAITLLAGAFIGKGVAFCKNIETKETKLGVLNFCIALLIALLVLVSVWSIDSRIYVYQAHTRWTGLWKNPNIFGLLMGMAIALVVGLLATLFERPLAQTCNRPLSAGQRLPLRLWIYYSNYFLYLFAVIFLGRGLLHSYSRGAWVGTAGGLGYLVCRVSRQMRKTEGEIVETSAAKSAITNRQARISSGSFISRFRCNLGPLFVILACIAFLAFLHFRQPEGHLARRAVSATNPADFSWRNRIVAWEGDLQIMVEHPWFGTGWNQPEQIYDHYYLPPKLTESAAIQMNDYLLLGATLGIPALFCFGMYLWLSLAGNAESGKLKAELMDAEWLQTTCRAGAIVLLIGFWFDGGLFKLPTAATFWILLELGNGRHELHEGQKQ